MCQSSLRFFVTGLLVCFAAYADAQVAKTERSSELASPERILAGEQPIDVAGFASPYFEDFDGDGLKDLLVGQLDYGRLRIYENIGSNERPKFDSFKWFEAGNRIAGVPTGCAVGFTPQLIDYDGDGRSDIVTGSFQGGLLFVFRRQADGSFAEAEVIENKDQKVQVFDLQYNSTVFLYDWDNDGDKDLFGGRRLCWVRNDGTDEKPVYGESRALVPDEVKYPAKKYPIGIPCVADWDGDGLGDLIVANVDVVWYRNIGTANQPKLGESQLLVRGSPTFQIDEPDAERKAPTRPYSVCVTDFNADGRVDLLLGDHHTNKADLTDDQRAEYAKVREWRFDFSRNYYDLIRGKRKLDPNTTQVAVFRDALKSWDNLSAIPFDGPQHAQYGLSRHGGVWLYRRQ